MSRQELKKLVCVLILVVAALALMAYLCGCSLFPHRLPPQNGTGGAKVGDAAAQVEKSAKVIDGERKSIEQEAPDTKPHTDIIGGEVQSLLAAKANLAAAEKSIEADRVLCAKKDARIKELEDSQNTLLKRWLQIIALLSLIGVPVAVLGLKSLPIGGICGAVFATCIAGVWLLAWAKWIALGAIVVIAGVVLYAIFVQRKTLTQVVETAERWKPVTSVAGAAKEDLARIANGVQSAQTQKIVASVRKKLGFVQQGNA